LDSAFLLEYPFDTNVSSWLMSSISSAAYPSPSWASLIMTDFFIVTLCQPPNTTNALCPRLIAPGLEVLFGRVSLSTSHSLDSSSRLNVSMLLREINTLGSCDLLSTPPKQYKSVFSHTIKAAENLGRFRGGSFDHFFFDTLNTSHSLVGLFSPVEPPQM